MCVDISEMSYIICDMNCDQETNKSDIEEHCSDCLCTGGLAEGNHRFVPARKAWRHTNVVEERGRLKTLSSRRSHRRKKNRRDSGRLNRGKVKHNRKINRRWRWKNRWRIKRLKLEKKAVSQATESPGNNPNKGDFSTELEARIDDESGSLDLDLTANTESVDTVKQAENTQRGTQAETRPTLEKAPRRRIRNQLRKAIIRFARTQEPYSGPLQQRGVSIATPKSGTRWLNAEREQQHPQKQRAKQVHYNQKLKWF